MLGALTTLGREAVEFLGYVPLDEADEEEAPAGKEEDRSEGASAGAGPAWLPGAFKIAPASATLMPWTFSHC